MSTLNKALRKSRPGGYRGAPLVEPQISGQSVVGSRALLDRHHDNHTPDPQGGQSTGRVIPLKQIHRNGIIAAQYIHPVADTYRILRARVLKRMVSQDVRSLGVCSATDGEGKTTTAANLALSLAFDAKYDTMLIDLDFKNPSVETVFSFKADLGLADYLGGSTSLQNCIYRTDLEHLSLLPAGRRCLNSSELISSPLMADLIEQLKDQKNNLILICDLPPVLASDDALVALSLIDASLFVVREGRTSIRDIQRCLDLISESQLFGTILNDSSDHFAIGKYY